MASITRSSKRTSPSEPLHMATRAASKTASMTGSSETQSNGSDNSRPNSSDLKSVNFYNKMDDMRAVKKPRVSHDDEDADAQLLFDALNETKDTNYEREIGAEATGFPLTMNEKYEVNLKDELESVTPTIENVGRELSMRPRVKPKRPKGWHLRKANRHLYQRSARHTPENFDKDVAESQSPSRNEPGGILKRLPGRRRAPHPDDDVEADLRRQLELKVAYRAVVKGLKPILAELASRTVSLLEEDAKLHESCDEYDEIGCELDLRLRKRLELLEIQSKLDQERLQLDLDIQTEIIKAQYLEEFGDHQDDCLLHCKYRIMSILGDIARECDEKSISGANDTFNSHNAFQHPDFENVPVPNKYDSRSKFFVDVENLWQDFESHHSAHQDQEPNHIYSIGKSDKFAVFDGDRRRDALAASKLVQLFDATQQVKRNNIKETNIIKKGNDSIPFGLRALADASEMLPPVESDQKSSTAKPISSAAFAEAQKLDALPTKKSKPSKPYYETFSFTDTFPGIVTGPLTPSEKRQIAARRRRTGKANILSTPASNFSTHSPLNSVPFTEQRHPYLREGIPPSGHLVSYPQSGFQEPAGHPRMMIDKHNSNQSLNRNVQEQRFEERPLEGHKANTSAFASQSTPVSTANQLFDDFDETKISTDAQTQHPSGHSPSSIVSPIYPSPYASAGKDPLPRGINRINHNHDQKSETSLSEYTKAHVQAMSPDVNTSVDNESHGGSIRPLMPSGRARSLSHNESLGVFMSSQRSKDSQSHSPLPRNTRQSPTRKFSQQESPRAFVLSPAQSHPSLHGAPPSFGPMHGDQIPMQTHPERVATITPTMSGEGRRTSFESTDRSARDATQHPQHSHGRYSPPDPRQYTSPGHEYDVQGVQQTSHIQASYPRSAPVPPLQHQRTSSDVKSPSHKDSKSVPLPQSLRRHPGQKMGQQLLPADLNPNRPNQNSSFVFTPSTSPSAPPHITNNEGHRQLESGRALGAPKDSQAAGYPTALASAPLQPPSHSQWPGFEARSQPMHMLGAAGSQTYSGFPPRYDAPTSAWHQTYGVASRPTETVQEASDRAARPWDRQSHTSPPAS